jgi:hypothetical protein
MNYFNRNHAVALSDSQIRQYAPSVFAKEAHESRSDRFAPIPTIAILKELEKEGFMVVSAKQSGARDQSKRNYTKHLLRLRHVDDLANHDSKARQKDTHAEIILRNANDGSSCYELMAGAYRLVCANGLIGFSPMFEGVKVRHTGDLRKVADNVIDGTFTVLNETNHLLASRDAWSDIRLSFDDKLALASAAHTVRFGDSEGHTDTPITPRQLLTVRRPADSGDDLWRVFNCIQENCIKGGLSAFNTKTNRQTGMREVKSIDQDVKINRALWQITDHFARQVKSAA